MVKTKKIGKFLEELSSSSPTPGGGSAAALTGSIAASLVEMVSNLTVGKEKYKKVQKRVQGIKTDSGKLREKLLKLAQDDIKAFDSVVRAYKKKSGVQKALKRATEVPLETAKLAREVEKKADYLIKYGNQNALSDAKSAKYLAQAAMKSAVENVKINVKSLSDSKLKEKFSMSVAKLK